MCRLWPEARSRAKPSPNRPGQAGPKCWPELAFGPAWVLGKQKPLAWAGVFGAENLSFNMTYQQIFYKMTAPVKLYQSRHVSATKGVARGGETEMPNIGWGGPVGPRKKIVTSPKTGAIFRQEDSGSISVDSTVVQNVLSSFRSNFSNDIYPFKFPLPSHLQNH